MKLTIIDTQKRQAFIQQTYDNIEDANARLKGIKEKFGARLVNKAGEQTQLAICHVGDDGEFLPLAAAKAEEKKKPEGK